VLGGILLDGISPVLSTSSTGARLPVGRLGLQDVLGDWRAAVQHRVHGAAHRGRGRHGQGPAGVSVSPVVELAGPQSIKLQDKNVFEINDFDNLNNKQIDDIKTWTGPARSVSGELATCCGAPATGSLSTVPIYCLANPPKGVNISKKQ
jgi:hypothetical protein